MQFMQLQLEPATSSTLPANGCGSIMQEIRLTNSMHGQVRVFLFTMCFSNEVIEVPGPLRWLLFV